MSTVTRHRAHRGNRGFTLVELVMAIAIMGLISTVIAAVITTAFKNNPMAEIRTDTAHTLKGLVTWLPQDVDSTPPTGFDLSPTATSGCASSPGKSLLRMEWQESVNGTTTRYVANYRWLSGAKFDTMVRVSCSGTGAFPLGNSRVLNASGPLKKMTAAWTPGSMPASVAIAYDLAGDVVLVTFDVETQEGSIMHVDSAPKNPAHTLPPTTLETIVGGATTVPATTVPPATTTTVPSGTTTTVAGPTTTTTTIPATTTTVPPCAVTGSSQNIASTKNTDPNGNGKAAVNVGVLTDALTITVTVSGVCSGLDARAATGAPNGELFHNFAKTGPTTFAVTFPGYTQGSSELWADGTRTINFYSPTGAVLGSTTLLVK